MMMLVRGPTELAKAKPGNVLAPALILISVGILVILVCGCIASLECKSLASPASPEEEETPEAYNVPSQEYPVSSDYGDYIPPELRGSDRSAPSAPSTSFFNFLPQAPTPRPVKPGQCRLAWKFSFMSLWEYPLYEPLEFALADLKNSRLEKSKTTTRVVLSLLVEYVPIHTYYSSSTTDHIRVAQELNSLIDAIKGTPSSPASQTRFVWEEYTSPTLFFLACMFDLCGLLLIFFWLLGHLILIIQGWGNRTKQD